MPAAAGVGAPLRPVRLALAAMATRFEIVLGGDDVVRLCSIGEAALREIADCEQVISPFLPHSMIARVNREACERAVRVDGMTFDLLQQCASLWQQSGGAFDITVGPLLRALGRRGRPAADAAGLAAARAAVSMQHVQLDAERQTVRLLRPGMALDLGAIGKGFALDLAGAVLREHGVESALLHGGTSSVLAIGAPAGLCAWRIGIGPWPRQPVASLRDGALSVSAPGAGGAAGGTGEVHVFDPRTGTVARGGLAAAAVLMPSATAADAWSTALCVLGEVEPPSGAGFLFASGSPPRWRGRGRLDAVDLPVPVAVPGCPS